MNFDDPLAAARGIILGLALALIMFWLPLTLAVIWWVSR